MKHEIAHNEYRVSEFLPQWFGWKYRMSTPTSTVAIIDIDSIEMLDKAIETLGNTQGDRLGSLYDHVGYCRKEFEERNNTVAPVEVTKVSVMRGLAAFLEWEYKSKHLESIDVDVLVTREMEENARKMLWDRALKGELMGWYIDQLGYVRNAIETAS